jgi:transposase
MRTGWTQRVPRRRLPHDVPKWDHVAYYFSKWLEDGPLISINACLREEIRINVDQEPAPRGGILARQRVKTGSRGEERGWDRAKPVKGRKRPWRVDPVGWLIVVLVTAAQGQARAAGQALSIAAQPKSHRLTKLEVDPGDPPWLVAWVKPWLTFVLALVVKPPEEHGFQVHPQRWIVERLFGWLNP